VQAGSLEHPGLSYSDSAVIGPHSDPLKQQPPQRPERWNGADDVCGEPTRPLRLCTIFHHRSYRIEEMQTTG
jgi:hypothetical protein